MALWSAAAGTYAMPAAAGVGCYIHLPDQPWNNPCSLYDNHDSITMQGKSPTDHAADANGVVFGIPTTAITRPGCKKPACDDGFNGSQDYGHSSCSSDNERTISGRTDDSQESSSSTSSTGSWLLPVLGWYAARKQAKRERMTQRRQAKVQYVSERAKWKAIVRGNMLPSLRGL